MTRDEQREKVLSMWSSRPAAAIAEVVKLTRNAVIGIANRARAKGDKRAIKKQSGRNDRVVNRVPSRKLPRRAINRNNPGGLQAVSTPEQVKQAQKDSKVRLERVEAETSAEPKRIHELKDGDCRFIIGSDMKDPKYCASSVKQGKRYCTHHYKICHIDMSRSRWRA